MSRTSSSTRMRKSDIDEAKRQAEKFAKMRDEKNNDPRRSEIPNEIKEKENKTSSLKISIEEGIAVLKDLRQCAEEQNSIDILERQVTQDMELIEEMKTENSFLLQQYNAQIPTNGTERELVSTMETLTGEVGDRLDTATRELEGSSDELKQVESRASKLSAVLNQNKNTLTRRKDQLSVLTDEGRGVQRIKQIIRAVRQYEQTTFGETDVPATVEPQELLERFTRRLGELATDSDQPETISRTIKKLKKLSLKKDASGDLIDIICPCCTRSLDNDEVRVFQETIETLADVTNSPIVQMDLTKAQLNASASKNYANWRNTGEY